MKHIYILILCILSLLYPWWVESASYTGQNPSYAERELDRSQGVNGFSFNNPGHPRNHSSQPHAPDYYPCVENASRNGKTKSAFDSRAIQNTLAHRALRHAKVIKAMGILNQYNKKNNNTIQYRRQVVTLTAGDLKLPNPKLTGGTWTNGVKKTSFILNGAVIVLQHYAGIESTPSAPVHIQTFYPN